MYIVFVFIVLQVSWRRAAESSPLTVGTLTFIDDNRFSIRHPKGSTKWHLVIDKVNLEDAGIYECQVPSKVRHLRSHILLIVRGEYFMVPIKGYKRFHDC